MAPPPNDPVDGEDFSKLAFVERLPLRWGGVWVGYGAALLLTGVALISRLALSDMLPPGFPFLTFFPVVMICAFLFGRGPGILCAFTSGMAAWYFLLSPVHTLTLNIGNAMALLFYLLVVTVDIILIDLSMRFARAAVRQREVSRQLAETRQLLFRELQHRVSNNLQVIGALLSAQRRRVTDPEAQMAIEEAATRLTVIGEISRELYHPDGEQADMAEFLRRLSEAVMRASGRSDVTCRLAVDGPLTLLPDQAVPLALVMTEALSNALEHGLPDRAGLITVTLHREGRDGLILSIEDDGAGLPDGFDVQATDQLGLRIAGQLAKQLRGSFALAPRDGASGSRATLRVNC